MSGTDRMVFRQDRIITDWRSFRRGAVYYVSWNPQTFSRMQDTGTVQRAIFDRCDSEGHGGISMSGRHFDYWYPVVSDTERLRDFETYVKMNPDWVGRCVYDRKSRDAHVITELHDGKLRTERWVRIGGKKVFPCDFKSNYVWMNGDTSYGDPCGWTGLPDMEGWTHIDGEYGGFVISNNTYRFVILLCVPPDKDYGKGRYSESIWKLEAIDIEKMEELRNDIKITREKELWGVRPKWTVTIMDSHPFYDCYRLAEVIIGNNNVYGGVM